MPVVGVAPVEWLRTLGRNVAELSEDEWEMRDSPTAHRSPILEEAEHTADLECALLVPSPGSLSLTKSFPLHVPRGPILTRSGQQGCFGTQRSTIFSADTLCA